MFYDSLMVSKKSYMIFVWLLQITYDLFKLWPIQIIYDFVWLQESYTTLYEIVESYMMVDPHDYLLLDASTVMRLNVELWRVQECLNVCFNNALIS